MNGMVALLLSPLAAAESKIEISGLVEVEALSAENYDGSFINDVSLATVGVAVDSKFDERTSAHIAFLYEEDVTDLSIDEGSITLGLSDSMSFTAGKMYVPFGRFNGFMISDPLTLVMSETNETALMLSGEKWGFYGSAYVFNGDSYETDKVLAGDNNSISSGVNLGYAREGMIDVGVSYITNIADSDTLQWLDDGNINKAVHTYGEVYSSVPGANAYFLVHIGNVTVIGEHVAALKSFSNGDLDGTVTAMEQPSASQFEIGIEFGKVILGMSYQQTSEAQFIGLAETVSSASVAYEVARGTTLAAEYASMKDYEAIDGGTGEYANTFTMQLAVGF